MKVACRLTATIPEDLPGARLSRRHRSACLTCQAEEVRQRALLRELAALRNEQLIAPPMVHARVMARLGPQDEQARVSRFGRGFVGGSIAATAIGAAAVFGGLAGRRARVSG